MVNTRSAGVVSVSFIITLLLTSLIVPADVIAAGSKYRIEAKLIDSKQLIDGKETIEFRNPLDQPVSEVVLLLSANLHREPNPYLSKVNLDGSYPFGFDPGWTRIHGVTGPTGEKLAYELDSLPPTSQTYSLEDTLLRVELAESLEPGDETRITVEFSTRIPRKKTGDEEYHRGIYTWRFGWHPSLTPAEWWTGYDEKVYSQTKLPDADYEVSLDVPKDFTVGGMIANESIEAAGKKRKLVELSLDNARSFPLSASSRYVRYRTQFKEFTVEVLHLPGYEQEARVLTTYANEVLNFYSEKFGRYKRDKLTFVQSPVSGYFGMAADGLIALGASFFEEKDLAFSSVTDRLSEYLIAHEIAHQWFGIGVGADLNSQNWISEAFSEYLALSYFHDKYPEDEANLFRFDRDGLIRNAIESQLGYINLSDHMFELPYIVNFQQGFDEAIVKPTEEVKYSQTTQTRIYKKGFLVLRTLEGIVGEESMVDFVRETYDKYDGKFVTVGTLAREIRDTAGSSLPEDFFQNWLFTDGYLDYGVANFTTEKLAENSFSTEVTVTKEGALTAPVTLRATLTSGDEVEKKVTLEAHKKLITLETESKVKNVTIDPESRVMDTNRLNNHYPRKVKVSLGSNDLPLDAYFVLVGPGTITGRTPNRLFWSIGPRSAQGRLNLNRNLSLSGGIAIRGNKLSELDVNGLLASRFDFWSQPKTGYAGEYWIQNNSLGLEFRRITSNDRTYNLFGAEASLSRLVSDNWNISLGTTFSPTGESKFRLSGRETERLLPNIYLNLVTDLGFSLGDLSPFLKFDLPELKSYGRWETDQSGTVSWKRTKYPGNYKLFSRLSLEFPISQDDNYFLGNLALIDGVTQSIFVSAGDTWNSLSEIELEGFKYEGGLELSFSGKTVGGLIPFELTVGYAYHLQDKGRPFFNFSLGF